MENRLLKKKELYRVVPRSNSLFLLPLKSCVPHFHRLSKRARKIVWCGAFGKLNRLFQLSL